MHEANAIAIIAAIAIDFGISIIPTRNSQDTAAMIKRIAVREQNGERIPISIRTDKKPVSLMDQQLFIVESLPNIGPVNAKNLLLLNYFLRCQHMFLILSVLNSNRFLWLHFHMNFYNRLLLYYHLEHILL